MAVNSTYGAAEREIRELFADYLEGDSSKPALALGAGPIAPEVRNALEKSLEAFGYAAQSCAYVSLVPRSASGAGDGAPLDPQALFVLVEGLDPLFVIAVDSAATDALGRAYRTSFSPDGPIRVFGRPSAAFNSLETLLQTPEGKQKAWRILKSLQA